MFHYQIQHILTSHDKARKASLKMLELGAIEQSKRITQPIEASKYRRYLPQLCAVMVKNIVLLAYGMTLGFPTIVIPAVSGGSGEASQDDLQLTDGQISWFSK